MSIHNDANTVIGVRWFFADADAPWLEAPTLFGSGNWASSKGGWFGPGEVQGAARPWYNGKAPEGLIGDHICGTLKMLAEGGSVDDPKICTNDDGVSSCCVDKLFCCDLAHMGPEIDIVIVFAAPLFGPPTHVGTIGMRFTLQRVADPLFVIFQNSAGIFLPGGFGPYYFTVACAFDAFEIDVAFVPFLSQAFGLNTKNKPPGVLFDGLSVPIDGGVSFEYWQFAVGTNPGPPPPPPPPVLAPMFPPGLFPPRMFPAGTFP